jgi:hypothetical protein
MEEAKKPKDTVLEVQNGVIPLSAFFERIDEKLKIKEDKKNG